MRYRKPNIFCYRIAQIVSFFVAKFVFKRTILRNEIKGKKGSFVIIANHQAALDFVNLMGITSRPLHFVISNSFYNSLPIKSFLDKLAVIPKQQFQTTISDMRTFKQVIENGEGLVIYPAGLMCEDGLSTPIPKATYKFLKWINTDIYVAKTTGTYFAMPKWAKGFRSGKTFVDVYKLFSREEAQKADIDFIKQKAEAALLFDAYKEQEEKRIKYKKKGNIQGIENVLYMCPECKCENSISVKFTNEIYCENCGFSHLSDEYSFLHKNSKVGNEIRYVSDWSRLIYNELKQKILNENDISLCAKTDIQMIDYKKHRFVKVGQGTVSLNKDGFVIKGIIHGEQKELFISIKGIPTLPFSPGKHFEIQQERNIYRCVLKDGKLAMKFINMVKIFYELSVKEAHIS